MDKKMGKAEERRKEGEERRNSPLTFHSNPYRAKSIQFVIGRMQQFPAVQLHNVTAPGGEQMQPFKREVVETDVLVVGARGFALRRRFLVGMSCELRNVARVVLC